MDSHTSKHPPAIIVAVTGASGSAYAQMLIEFLLTHTTDHIYLVISNIGKQVVRYELKPSTHSGSLVRLLSEKLNTTEATRIRIFNDQDFFAPIASGTAIPQSMVVVPCSMGTVARIATGLSSSLIERSADVMIKQKKQLIVCPRESPLSALHLSHLLTLANLNAHIIPLMPAMYQKPKTVEDVVRFSVGRICEALGYAHSFYQPWGKRRIPSHPHP